MLESHLLAPKFSLNKFEKNIADVLIDSFFCALICRIISAKENRKKNTTFTVGKNQPGNFPSRKKPKKQSANQHFDFSVLAFEKNKILFSRGFFLHRAQFILEP